MTITVHLQFVDYHTDHVQLLNYHTDVNFLHHNNTGQLKVETSWKSYNWVKLFEHHATRKNFLYHAARWNSYAHSMTRSFTWSVQSWNVSHLFTDIWDSFIYGRQKFSCFAAITSILKSAQQLSFRIFILDCHKEICNSFRSTLCW